MGKVEKITIKLAMLFIGLSLLFPARVLAAEKNEINEITEKKQIIFLLDASKSMQGDGQWIEAADSACMIASALPERILRHRGVGRGKGYDRKMIYVE